MRDVTGPDEDRVSPEDVAEREKHRRESGDRQDDG
jgi:hypothetical protein